MTHRAWEVVAGYQVPDLEKPMKKAFSISSSWHFNPYPLGTVLYPTAHAPVSSPVQLDVKANLILLISICSPNPFNTMEQHMRAGHATNSLSGPVTFQGSA